MLVQFMCILQWTRYVYDDACGTTCMILRGGAGDCIGFMCFVDDVPV